MKNVLLKNVSEEDWIKFRTEAIAHDMTIPEFLSYLIREHIKKYHTKSKWDKILSTRLNLDIKEWQEMEKTIEHVRGSFSLER
ncbi:MAG TPA: hypothetical protein VI912_03690 [Candidatus Bilamarchaeaceae archaeon]|nr:hypothetical protein [Candidatus Bilamarchaeaceae archaeon]